MTSEQTQIDKKADAEPATTNAATAPAGGATGGARRQGGGRRSNATFKHTRVKPESTPCLADELRVTRFRNPFAYVEPALKLLLEHSTVRVSGIGTAIPLVVELAEILKHQTTGLHQETKIVTFSYEQKYVPQEAGLDEISTKPTTNSIVILLSKDVTKVDTKSVGYQPPLPDEEILQFKEQREQEVKARRERRSQEAGEANGNETRGYRGRGRGRGGFRGRGRGGRGRGRGGRGGRGRGGRGM